MGGAQNYPNVQLTITRNLKARWQRKTSIY